MRQGRLLSCALLAGMLSSVALAGGPFGAPMSILAPGQWAVDGGYWYEEVDLYGSAGITEYFREWEFGEGEGDEDGWGESELWDLWDQRLKLDGLETHTYVGSLEYGFCENLDLYVRLGAVSAEGDLVGKDVDWEYDYEEDLWYATIEKWKESLDFGTGFTWQIGTRFTICRSGAWTWGGRMQFGMVDGGSASSRSSWVEEEAGEGGIIRYVETEEVDADLEWWQAVAYIGPTYQLSDVLQVYIAGGWQTLHGTLDIESTWTDSVIGVTEGELGEEEELFGKEQSLDKGSFKLKHASPIAVFGAAWAPREDLNIGVDALIGEAGKWGLGVSASFAF